ncbi:MAG: hypothetical protein Q4P72_04015 [Eubacteriales bacterium]|nr:hypothetical protein [Eubacteriales bacterium]
MAGLFGLFDFTKEGPGVDRDEATPPPVQHAFQIYFRKFWTLIACNLEYLLFSLPILVLAYFANSVLLAFLFPNFSVLSLSERLQSLVSKVDEAQSLQQASLIYLIFQILFTFFSVGLMFQVFGPVHAGSTLLFRNFSREDHAFLWMDFKDCLVDNFRQSLLVGLGSFVAHFVVLFAISFYAQQIHLAWLRAFCLVFLIFVFIYIAMMQFYIYPLLITFDLKLKQVVKNSALFAILRLPQNLLLVLNTFLIFFVIPALFFYLLPFSIAPLLALIWYLFFAFSLNFFVVNFYVQRQIKRFMLDRIETSTAEETSAVLRSESNSSTEEDH